MKIFINAVLIVLVFLAVSSGVSKILLMEQEVNFFASYGFTSPLLIAYGATQLTGGVLMVLKKTRVIGALVVAVTFLISAVVLMMAKNWLVTVVTFVAILLLFFIIWRELQNKKNVSS